MPSPTCPSCAAHQTVLIGRLPDIDCFAGRRYPHRFPGGELYLCGACRMRFRHPRLTIDEYASLYAAGAEQAWDGPGEIRLDWQETARRLRGAKAGRILDIGCADGSFLASLPDDWDKSGIEINPGAARRAAERGIQIAGGDIEALDSESARYDVVSAFDIIEHVADPRRFLRRLAGLIRPDGWLFVSTGNPDAWSWRLARNRYWYCAFPEHISFLPPAWFSREARNAKLEIAAHRTFSRRPGVPLAALRETALNTLFLTAPKAFQLLLRQTRLEENASAPGERPPPWMTAADHQLVVLRRLP